VSLSPSQSESRMRQIRTSGLMSGEGKRSHWPCLTATAPFLDSTFSLEMGRTASLPAVAGPACGARLDDHERLGEAGLVGEGQVEERLGSRRQDRSEPRGAR